MTSPAPQGIAPADNAPSRSRWVVYLVLIAVLVVGMGTAVAAHSIRVANENRQAAADKAVLLSKAFIGASLSPIPQDVAVETFGTDGGALCARPDSSLVVSLGPNGAAGPGERATTLDERRIEADRLVIQVYCPDKRGQYEKFVTSLNLKLGDTTTRE